MLIFWLSDRDLLSLLAYHFPREGTISGYGARDVLETGKQGDAIINYLQLPRPHLYWLFQGEDPDARSFCDKARKYNTTFAFTSVKYQDDEHLAGRGGVQCFQVQINNVGSSDIARAAATS
jgi:hypothetical protein